MFSAWGNNMPWGISPFGPSTEVLYASAERLPIVGTIVEDLAVAGDVTQETAIAGTISTEVTM